MCGIVGIVSPESVSERLLEGLKRLEYRGYDSSGIATVVAGEIGVYVPRGSCIIFKLLLLIILCLDL